MAIQEDLSRNFGFILHDVARLLRTTFDRRVKGMGLTRSQWWVLLHVFRMNGVSQSELADELEIEKATLGRLLDRLEINGWLRRESDAVDRRVKRIFLPVPPIVTGIAAHMLEPISNLTGKRPRITYDMHYLAGRFQFYDSSKAKRELDYNPRGYREIVKEYFSWARNRK